MVKEEILDGEILIVPDVHGRTFWEQPVREALDTGRYKKIVFLGDYLDPYPRENITFEQAWDNFQAILSCKMSFPDKVVLLLGNHDLHYIADDLKGSRYDYDNAAKIWCAFSNNIKAFDMVWWCGDVPCPVIICSHAGINPRWLNGYLKDIGMKELGSGRTEFLDLIRGGLLNNPLHAGITDGWVDPDKCQSFINALSWVSNRRGGYHPVGSMIWNDILDWTWGDMIPGIIQITGHTQAIKPIYLKGDGGSVYCLDVRKCFRVDVRSGSVCDLEGNPVMPMSKKVEERANQSKSLTSER